jgi:Cu-Zn family superoxide dismutase
MELRILLGLFSVMTVGIAHAASLTVPMSMMSLVNAPIPIGNIVIKETQAGLLFTPDLKLLPSGPHGFHVHDSGNCGPGTRVKSPAMAAGGHFDPGQTLKHSGPNGRGHLGDLPLLLVSPQGTATAPVLVPRLKQLKEVKGRALIIHAGSDNYADTPVKYGAGGSRIACGVI